MNIPYEYVQAELNIRYEPLRKAQLDGSAYLKRDRKPSPVRRWFANRNRSRAVQPRYTPLAGQH